MSGNQFSFKHSSYSDIKEMLDIVIYRFNLYFNDYNLSKYDVAYVN